MDGFTRGLNTVSQWFTDTFAKFGEIPLFAVIIVASLLAASVGGLIVYTVRRKKEEPQPVKQKKGWDAKMLITGALAISLGTVLSLIKIVHMPQGGSVTLASMLPVMIFSYIYGVPKGSVVAFAYSLLQLMVDPFVVHWAQLLTDYTLAYTALCLAGLFRRSILPGIVLASAVRYALHVLSGVIFFAEYAQGQNVLVYSSLYNSYVLIDAAVMVFIVLIVPQLRKFIQSQKALARN